MENISNQNEEFMKKIRNFLLRPVVSIVITVLLITGTVLAAKNYFSQNDVRSVVESADIGKEVAVAKVNKELGSDSVSAVGVVKAESKINVIALTQGTAVSVLFEKGDAVYSNQSLVFLNNNQASTNYNTTQNTFVNLQNSMNTTKRIIDENISQAQLGVDSALESVRATEISLESAHDNLKNSLELQQANIDNLKDGALISFFDYLNTAKNALDQVNYIINAENGIQLGGIAETLSVKNSNILNEAKNNYVITKRVYNNLSLMKPDRNSIQNRIGDTVELLYKVQSVLDQTIEVLDNTIASINFSESALNVQRSGFSSLRSVVVNTENGAKALYQNFDKILLANKQETTVLENAIKAVEKNLDLANIAYDNAKARLSAAKESGQQQIIGAQTSLDSAAGQLGLSANQLNDLVIKTPISGRVTGKFIEQGSEIMPGQTIAEVSQIDTLKIEASVPSEDVYRLKIGQKAIINKRLEGVVTKIDPTADVVSRKVKIEISFDNSNQELIVETFVDVDIELEKLDAENSGFIFVPLRAVSVEQNLNYVYINDNNVAKKVEVKTGKTENAYIEIISGLNIGDELIIDGNKNLENGDKLIIL